MPAVLSTFDSSDQQQVALYNIVSVAQFNNSISNQRVLSKKSLKSLNRRLIRFVKLF